VVCVDSRACVPLHTGGRPRHGGAASTARAGDVGRDIRVGGGCLCVSVSVCVFSFVACRVYLNLGVNPAP